jgi:phage terminase small subunit
VAVVFVFGGFDLALTGRREAFVAYYCGEAKQNASEAARLAGYANPAEEGYRLLRNDQIAAAVAAFRAEIKARGIAHKQNRLDSYVRDFELTEQVIAARSTAYADAPGGTTGLLVGQLKTDKHVEETDDGEKVSRSDVWEYAVDTALLNERLKLRKQIAQELGEWVERGEQSIAVETRQAAEKVAAKLGIPVDVVISETTRWLEDEA